MVGSPESRVTVRGGVLGPLDVGELRTLRSILEDFLADETDNDELDELPDLQKQLIVADKAQQYFKHVIDTGNLY